jgi:hypothetical protein
LAARWKRDHVERAALKRVLESIAAIVAAIVALAVFAGVWALIARELWRFGAWGIAAAVALIVLQLVLLIRVPSAGAGLFGLAAIAAALLQLYRHDSWWALVLLALMSTVIAFMAPILFAQRRVRIRHVEASYEYRSSAAAKAIEALARASLLKEDDRRLEQVLTMLTSGEFPKAAVRRRRSDDVPRGEEHPVDCTVFSPEDVGRGAEGLLQVFLHAPDEAKDAEAAARSADRNAKKRGFRSLVVDAPHGTRFDFEVSLEGLSISLPTSSLLWMGRPQAATFAFQVPKRARFGQHTGTVVVIQDDTPIGSISFQIEARFHRASAALPSHCRQDLRRRPPARHARRLERARRHARDLHGMPRDVQAEDRGRGDMGVVSRPRGTSASVGAKRKPAPQAPFQSAPTGNRRASKTSPHAAR